MTHKLLVAKNSYSTSHSSSSIPSTVSLVDRCRQLLCSWKCLTASRAVYCLLSMTIGGTSLHCCSSS
eukprot:17824-Heterococcus_DN1.PRE.2